MGDVSVEREIEEALRNRSPTGFRSTLISLRARGVSLKELEIALGDARQRHPDDEAAEDLLIDALDGVTGWTSPYGRIE